MMYISVSVLSRLLPKIKTNNNIICQRPKTFFIDNLRAVITEVIPFSFHWTDSSTQLWTDLETSTEWNHVLGWEKKRNNFSKLCCTPSESQLLCLQEWSIHITFASHAFEREYHISQCAEHSKRLALQCIWHLCYEDEHLAVSIWHLCYEDEHLAVKAEGVINSWTDWYVLCHYMWRKSERNTFFVRVCTKKLNPLI